MSRQDGSAPKDERTRFIRKQDRPALFTAVAVLILGNLVLIVLQAPIEYAFFVFPLAIVIGFLVNYAVHGQFSLLDDSQVK